MNKNKKTITLDQLRGLVGESEESDFEIRDGVLVKYNGDGGDVVIPDDVTKIGSFAFENCDGVTSVKIPEGVTKIGNSAFSGCAGLTSVTTPGSLSVIGDYAFSGCVNLESVRILEPGPEIGEFAFAGTPWGDRTFKNYMYGTPSRRPERTWQAMNDMFSQRGRIMKLNENQKVTLTLGQLKRLVKETSAKKTYTKKQLAEGNYKKANKNDKSVNNYTLVQSFENGMPDVRTPVRSVLDVADIIMEFMENEIANSDEDLMIGDFAFYVKQGENYTACLEDADAAARCLFIDKQTIVVELAGEFNRKLQLAEGNYRKVNEDGPLMTSINQGFSIVD